MSILTPEMPLTPSRQPLDRRGFGTFGFAYTPAKQAPPTQPRTRGRHAARTSLLAELLAFSGTPRPQDRQGRHVAEGDR